MTTKFLIFFFQSMYKRKNREKITKMRERKLIRDETNIKKKIKEKVNIKKN